MINEIHSKFAIRDGLIVEHTDTFDFWRWSRQALGLKGWLLGGTSFVQDKIRKEARKGLAEYRRQAAS